MIHRYRSDYPNQVHILNLSISKHLYIAKNDEIKYQKKGFDINLNNFRKSNREHVIHYLIKDHYSGAYYGEIYSANNEIHIKDFLCRAWFKKDEYEFMGIPELLVVPKIIYDKFPDIKKLFIKTNIKDIKATSGFQAGASAVREWERNISIYSYLRGLRTIQEIQNNIQMFNKLFNESKIVKWKKNVNQDRVFDSKDIFFKIFDS